MRIRRLIELVEELVAGGSGGGIPDLTSETNILDWSGLGSGLDLDGLLPGPLNFRLRDLEWNNEDGVLDPNTAYLVVASYVITDPDTDWGGLDLIVGESGPGASQARVESLAGPATLDTAGLRSTVMPAGIDLNIALGTDGCRLSNVQLYPLV